MGRESCSPAPNMGRMGRGMQRFVDVNFPLKLSHGLRSSGAFLGHQDGDLNLSRIGPDARGIRQGLCVGQMLPGLEVIFPAFLPNILQKPTAPPVLPVPQALQSECLGQALLSKVLQSLKRLLQCNGHRALGSGDTRTWCHLSV